MVQTALAVCICSSAKGVSEWKIDMYERRYIMSVRGLMDNNSDENIWNSVEGCLDRDRLEKLERIKALNSKAACAGAGLLLQWAFFRWQAERAELTDAEVSPNISLLTLNDIVKEIKSPFDFGIYYGPHGKPYIKEQPFFYNISHSEDYVFCAVSGQEIGADIQRKVSGRERGVAERFFSVREKAAIREICDDAQKRDMFFRLWTRKEALGKLSGDGIAACVDKCLLDLDEGIASEYIWEEYDIIPDYNIVCCRDRK